jgi:hypothetical protein
MFWNRKKKSEFDLIIEQAVKHNWSKEQLDRAIWRPISKETQELIDLQKANQEKAEKEYQEFYNKCLNNKEPA